VEAWRPIRRVSGLAVAAPVDAATAGRRVTGPNLMADKIRDDLDDIAAELDGGGLTRERRSELNKRAHRLKGWLRWCESRAGYVVP